MVPSIYCIIFHSGIVNTITDMNKKSQIQIPYTDTVHKDANVIFGYEIAVLSCSCHA